MTAASTPARPAGTLRWLLKREYWENRGGFFYAPLIAAGVSLLMSGVGILFGLFALKRVASEGNVRIDNQDVNINGLDLGLLTRNLDAADRANLANGMDLTLVLSSSWPFIVLAFVVFFYCLGALYDDRRDRSILFWKSLPLSDTQTVVSKVLSAVLVAPLIAVLASILTMFCFGALISAVVLAHGGDPMALIWGPASPMLLAAGHLAWIPVFILWSLPTVGWLLLCSAWAKSKPFLWAVMLPVFAGVVVSTTKVMTLFDLGSGWFWQHVVGRLLLGTLPGTDLLYRASAQGEGFNRGVDSFVSLLSPSQQLASLAMPQLWIGAAFGVLFIIVAIRLRRRAGEL